jgi:hypothetical protein
MCSDDVQRQSCPTSGLEGGSACAPPAPKILARQKRAKTLNSDPRFALAYFICSPGGLSYCGKLKTTDTLFSSSRYSSGLTSKKPLSGSNLRMHDASTRAWVRSRCGGRMGASLVSILLAFLTSPQAAADSTRRWA